MKNGCSIMFCQQCGVNLNIAVLMLNSLRSLNQGFCKGEKDRE